MFGMYSGDRIIEASTDLSMSVSTFFKNVASIFFVVLKWGTFCRIKALKLFPQDGHIFFSFFLPFNLFWNRSSPVFFPLNCEAVV